MASITRRERKVKGRRATRWEVRFRTPDGREKSELKASRAEAKARLTEIEEALRKRRWIDPDATEIPLAVWAERWLAAVSPTLKPKTRQSYRSLLESRILPTFGAWPLAAIRSLDVQAWVNGMVGIGLSASRIRQASVVLAKMLDAAVKDGRLTQNAARGLQLPRIVRSERPYLTPEQVASVASKVPTPYDLLVSIMGTLGPRWGEAAALRRRSVDLLGRRLVISESVAEISGEQVFGPPKSYQVRRLPLPRSLQGRLEGHLSRIDADAAALLFPAPRKPDRPFRYTSFRSNYWIPALRAAGLPHVGVHALRHSAAALLISRGASLKELQSIMGHSSAAFTLSVYGHLFDDDLDALADRLDAASRRAAMGRERDGALVAIAGATRETGN